MENKNPMIKITVAGMGEMTAELYPDKAPATVENFLKLVKEGFFSGMIFHRVIKGFMIQGGGYTADFKEKAGMRSAMLFFREWTRFCWTGSPSRPKVHMCTSC